MRMRSALATFSTLALLSLAVPAQTPFLEHCCQGLTTDAFMSDDGSHAWVAEDGGRIRYRNTLIPASQWAYQAVPETARDTLRRIFFLPDNMTGWAVGENGTVLKTTNGGQTWTQGVHQFTPQLASGAYDGFWDVHFITPSEGWLVGLHGIWKTTTGATGFAGPGAEVTLLDAGGSPIDPASIEIYSLDVLNCPGSNPVVIACAQPGLVFRNTNPAGTEMQVVWDIQQTCEQMAPRCGTGPLEHLIGEPLWNAICATHSTAFEPWDIEFQRTCNPNPLLVMVGGVGTSLGVVLSSTDLGTTWKRECHECEVNPTFCENSQDYKPNSGSPDRYWRLKFFWTLYGVALFPDGTGIASGYSGQHVVRQANGVWVDRSSYSSNFMRMSEASCPNAMNGAACEKGANSSVTAGNAIIVGQGGWGRVTDSAIAEPNPTNPPNQAPENWIETMPSTWWRLRATSFTTDVRGWRTGQMDVIARTDDGGVSWIRETTEPYDGTGSCNSIAMAPGATFNQGGGVAVGEPDYRQLNLTPGMVQNGTSFIGFPKILRRVDNQGPVHWVEPMTLNFSPTAQNRLLYDVVWGGTGSSGNVYWACGKGGLIVRSVDDGANWSQVRGGALSTSLFFTSISAKNSGELVAVGINEATQVGVAVMLTGTSTGTGVTSISVPSGLVQLSDVTIQGTTAYAVGTKIVSGLRKGVVLSAPYTGGAFSTFTEINSPSADACAVGDALGDYPPLNQIAVTPNGELWAGGECGRLWRFTGGTSWIQAKSQTDAHIVNMSVTPGGYIYITGARQNLTGSAIVRWHP